MSSFNKSGVTCEICKKILSDPINLPCHCVICKENLSDKSVKDGLIKCEPCGDEFIAKDVKIIENNLLKKLLANQDYLTYQEKEAKKEIHEQISKAL